MPERGDLPGGRRAPRSPIRYSGRLLLFVVEVAQHLRDGLRDDRRRRVRPERALARQRVEPALLVLVRRGGGDGRLLLLRRGEAAAALFEHGGGARAAGAL